MAIPSWPYSSRDTVTMLMASSPTWTAGFSANTKPTDTTVDYFLKMVAAAVDMHLSQAGYILPLAVISGEEWPDSQTYFMDYLVALGTAGLIGNTLRPSPAMGPGTENSPGNIFYQQYNTWLAKIASGTMGLRASYRIATPAEQFLLSPLGPRWTYGDTDFTEMADVVNFWASAFEEAAWLSMDQSYALSYRAEYD